MQISRQKSVVAFPPNILSPTPLMEVRGQGGNILLRMTMLEGTEMRYVLGINGLPGGYALRAQDFIGSAGDMLVVGTGDGSTTDFDFNANTLHAAQSSLGIPVPIMPCTTELSTLVGASTEYLRDDGGPDPSTGVLLGFPGDGKLYWSDGISTPVFAGTIDYFSGEVRSQWPTAPDNTEDINMDYRHTLVSIDKVGSAELLSAGGEDFVRGIDLPNLTNNKGRVFPLLDGDVMTINGASKPSSNGNKPTSTKVLVEVEFIN